MSRPGIGRRLRHHRNVTQVGSHRHIESHGRVVGHARAVHGGHNDVVVPLRQRTEQKGSQRGIGPGLHDDAVNLLVVGLLGKNKNCRVRQRRARGRIHHTALERVGKGNLSGVQRRLEPNSVGALLRTGSAAHHKRRAGVEINVDVGRLPGFEAQSATCDATLGNLDAGLVLAAQVKPGDAAVGQHRAVEPFRSAVIGGGRGHALRRRVAEQVNPNLLVVPRRQAHGGTQRSQHAGGVRRPEQINLQGIIGQVHYIHPTAVAIGRGVGNVHADARHRHPHVGEVPRRRFAGGRVAHGGPNRPGQVARHRN